MRQPQACQVGRPAERCYYFKAPKWLGCSEAVRDGLASVPLALLGQPIHFFAQEITAKAHPRPGHWERTDADEDPGAQQTRLESCNVIYSRRHLDVSEPHFL